MSEHTNAVSHKPESSAASQPELNMAYVLSRMDMVLQEKQYLEDAIRAIRELEPVEGPCLQIDSRASAIGDAVSAREQTNQKILALLERMYNDLQPRTSYQELSSLLPVLENPLIPNGIKMEIFRTSGAFRAEEATAE